MGYGDDYTPQLEGQYIDITGVAAGDYTLVHKLNVDGSLLEKTASNALRGAGIRHVVVGGLAVGAHGFPRATKDVDFLVGDEAFEQHAAGLVTLRAGVPFRVGTVPIDFLNAQPGEHFLTATLDADPGSIVGAGPLVYLKLKSPRHRDRTDIIELIKSGLDIDACRQYLAQYAPAFADQFESAVARARAEEE